MSDAKAKKIVFLKMPSFTRFLIAGLMAYWLSTIMNPAFVAIAVLFVLIIPVLTIDNIFARQFENAYRKPEEIKPRTMTKSEYRAALEAKNPELAKKKEKEPLTVNTPQKAKKSTSKK